MEHYQLVTTVESASAAGKLAEAIVTARLGACAHIMPITSVYRWDGEVTREAEWRLVVKTTRDRLDELMAFVKQRHSYDLPQLVATELAAGSADYLDWITAETRRP
ncbi:divalent-cation tolerance protein CutA [Labedaea rhizosphaerae]|uniref:Periplasmic divalent cation tolerance protein n=1 Tax=Labedaea rhizosphaerae TaxID=598644 RepID=A0A4R6SDI3_LABRH|nr:divalent-cation tolerance protein CutA [Labedaea rhizosphaerae]TDP98189.1 periplasmic divalent cation tolerance protein [Labedaea rhizosphaerae]